jgi:hypothetical protein
MTAPMRFLFMLRSLPWSFRDRVSVRIFPAGCR